MQLKAKLAVEKEYGSDLPMPRNRYNAIGAMFDVKPVDATGAVDVAKIKNLPAQINLRSARSLNSDMPQPKWRDDVRLQVRKSISSNAIAKPEIPSKSVISDNLHQLMNAKGDWQTIFTELGIKVENSEGMVNKPRQRPIAIPKKDPTRAIHERILNEMRQPIESISELPLIAPELAVQITPPLVQAVSEQEQRAIEEWYHASLPTAERIRENIFHKIQGITAGFFSGPGIKIRILIIAIVLGLVGYGVVFAMGIRRQVIEEGNSAVSSLEQARLSLEKLDFVAASEGFLAAYNEFANAGETLNFMGTSISSFLSELPGGSQFKSAQSLIHVGQLVADAGQSMSDAVGAIAKTGIVLNPSTSSKVFLSEIMAPLREALVISGKNLKEVSVLVADIDLSSIPEDKQDTFEKFTSQLPQFEQLVDRGVEFANFFERLIGSRGEKKYLFLFQNHSELRPTGGFAGSYGVLIFENGRLKDFFVDDVYNIDGQLKELIVPPLQLQHITPSWAMRDAAWFVDFPTSAQKVLAFYKKEGGRELDGIITLNPDIIAEILKVVGPIEMPEYNLVLTSDNFLPEVQREVEYGENKKINKPKKIITDMTPVLMQKLYSADKSTWLNVVNIFMAGLEEKNVLMYFKDQKLQGFSQEQGFSGEVEKTDSDYLMVNFSNIKGSKTDEVMDTTLQVQTILAENALGHKVIITREHKGGSSPYGFYNRQNPSYVRVLVPKGARLISVAGNANPSFKPLLDYPKTNFTKDVDLMRLEQGVQHDNGVFENSESDKTEFGFWMIVDPGKTGTVELEYTLPISYENNTYELYLQKQPGLRIKDFSWSVTTAGALEITGSNVTFRTVGANHNYNTEIKKDLSLMLRVK